MAKGYIYILTNESFHRSDWIKIGYSTDVAKRVKQLSNTSVPKPFKVYATYELPDESCASSDKQLHGLILSLDPSLKIDESREFFEMEPESAYAILYAIARIHGREEKLIDGPGRKEFLASASFEKASPRSLPRMDWCMEQGLISVGDKVHLRGFEEAVATVVDEKRVNYNGAIMSYNVFGCTVTGWCAIQIYNFLVVNDEDYTIGQKRESRMKELNMLD